MDIKNYLNPDPIEQINEARIELKKIKKILVGTLPEDVSEENLLADKHFVNMRLAEADADFKGTYLTMEELLQVTGNRNDYAYLEIVEGDKYRYKRYKWTESPSGTGGSWEFEFAIDLTYFTEAEWAAIRSGMTNALTTKINELPNNATLQATLSDINTAIGQKLDTISDLATIRSGAAAGATAYQKPSLGIPKTDLASGVQTSLGKADTALQLHQDISGKANISDLATVATSGDYNDLSNKPTNVSAFTNDAGYLTQHQDISGKVDVADFEEAEEVTAEALVDLDARVTALELAIEALTNNA